jgi:hypothetical protein
LDPRHMRELFVSGEIRSASEQTDPHAAETFYGPKKSELETSQPLLKAALRNIGQFSPESLPFAQIVTTARAEVGRKDDTSLEADAEQLAEALLRAAIAGAVDLYTRRPAFVLDPGERPVASRLAQLQLQHSNRASSMLHRRVQLDDALTRTLLLLLDGSRDRAALCEELNAAIRDGDVAPPECLPEITMVELDRAVRGIAKLGLIVG